jgi:glyoxylate reductase
VPRVFVSRSLPGDGLDRLRDVCDVEVWPDADPPPPAALIEAACDKDGLLTMLPDRVGAELFDAAPSVRIVSNLAVGYDTIDVTAATQRGVLVTNTPGVLTETVADLTFALLLSFARRIVEGDRMVREGRWGAWSPLLLVGKEVHHATLGIVGLGEIGTALARRALGFNMRVIYNSRTRKPELEHELGLEWRELPDLLRDADFVSVNVSLSPQTRGLIGAEQLALMKPDAVLINASRGPVVDQPALVEALRRHRIGGAALDVFAVEPIPADDPLLALDNVIVAPHVGSATLRTRTLMADLAVRNLIAFFRGERPPACVNPEVLR